MAKLYFFYGAMNCGKTTRLIQTAYNYEQRGRHVFVIKPGVDTKGGEFIVSRVGVARKVDSLVSSDDDLTHLPVNMVDVVLVDEAQFLEPEQVDQLLSIVTRRGIPVLCYGLRSDFLQKGFPGATRLLEVAHEIEEMKTICFCGRKAIFNIRVSESGDLITEGSQVLIDNGSVTYDSICDVCLDKRRG